MTVLSTVETMGKPRFSTKSLTNNVRNWVLKYDEMGEKGLEDRRGQRAGSKPARTPEEEMRDKLAQQERRIKLLEMENDLLKKVSELERRRDLN